MSKKKNELDVLVVPPKLGKKKLPTFSGAELGNLKSGDYTPLDADKTYIVFGSNADVRKVKKAYLLRNIIEKIEKL